MSPKELADSIARLNKLSLGGQTPGPEITKQKADYIAKHGTAPGPYNRLNPFGRMYTLRFHASGTGALLKPVGDGKRFGRPNASAIHEITENKAVKKIRSVTGKGFLLVDFTTLEAASWFRSKIHDALLTRTITHAVTKPFEWQNSPVPEQGGYLEGERPGKLKFEGVIGHLQESFNRGINETVSNAAIRFIRSIIVAALQG
jgi:hypothetical protein